MNVRDPFNIRTGSLNRPPIATWKSNRSYNSPSNNPFPAPLHQIIRTAATATQSAAADLRDKAGEVVQSAQQVLAGAAAAALDTGGDHTDAVAEPQQERKQKHRTGAPYQLDRRQQQPQPRPDIDLEKQALPRKNKDKDKEKDKEKDMSFGVPRNVPPFTNPQRQNEDRLWAAATASSRQRATGGGVLGGVQSLFSPHHHGRASATALPMYKDKPYMYPPGGAGGWRRPLYRRKRACGLLLLVVVAALVWWTGLFAEHQERAVTRLNQWGWLRQEEREGADGGGRRKDWLKRRQRVVEAMELSWDAYERYAWGASLCFLRLLVIRTVMGENDVLTPGRQAMMSSTPSPGPGGGWRRRGWAGSSSTRSTR
jgi:mannosyl-oligosaccharide alpha-1,2-mannosidase